MVKCALCGKYNSIREARFKRRTVDGKLQWVHLDCLMKGLLIEEPNPEEAEKEIEAYHQQLFEQEDGGL